MLPQLSLYLCLLSLLTLATAQFQFFEQMFQGGQQQQQQQPQNVASDSTWYQANYDQGILLLFPSLISNTPELSSFSGLDYPPISAPGSPR